MIAPIFLSGVNDLDRSIAFYSAAGAPVGIIQRFDYSGLMNR